MDSTRDYAEAMVPAVREHEREIGAMAKATEGARSRRENLGRLARLLDRPAPMTVGSALQAWNACASSEWWAAQARLRADPREAM